MERFLPARTRPVIMAFLIAVSPAQAQGLANALLDGTPLIDLRLRYDTVRQSDKAQDAEATTARARLGYQTGRYAGFSGLAEVDAVQHLGAKQFDDSVGGLTQYPIIADPDMVALNRLQLDYKGNVFASPGAAPDMTFVLGRQVIVFSDLRYVGNSTWRQHELTFDALTVANTSLPDTALTYSYVAGVNRTTGPRSATGHFDSDSHLFNGVYMGLPHLKLEGFAYVLDFQQAPLLSSATYGFSAVATFDLGGGLIANVVGTVARQRDYGRNPLAIDLGNYRAEGGLSYGGFSGAAGYEIFEGNGTMGFQTPLGTGHQFQGWAETFTNKPPEGVTDTYAKASYAFRGIPFFANVMPAIVYHDFAAQNVRADYGREWDAMLEAQIDGRLTLDIAYADYRGHGFFPDKRELWTYVTYHY
jgi:hypothetical protein